ncbi:MAG: dihydrodipicolinate synthase family protein [Acidobacteriota bacterium]|nr:dihydrodipicolinate synthase family protein [Acidobacteriota bacterium]
MPERRELRGVFAPLTTPFDSDDHLSLPRLRQNLARYNATRLAGYVITGSTGEAILLSWAETEELWAAVVEAAAADKILIAGTAAETTKETILRTRRAADLGFEVALVRTPHYYQSQMTPEVLADYYHRVADASPIPILIYSIPQYTGITVEAPLVERLSEHPNIAGIKDSSGSVQRAAELVSVARRNFRVLVGSASTFFAALMVGASGGILALADALPEACVELYELSMAGKIAEARALQERILPASKALVSRWGATSMKYALDRLGYYGGPVREPLRPLGEVARREIDELLAAIQARAAK